MPTKLHSCFRWGHPQLHPFPTWRAGRWTWPNTSRQFSFQVSGKGEESLSLGLLTPSRPSPALPSGPLLREVSLTPRPAWRPVYPRTAACTRHHGRSHNCQRLFGGSMTLHTHFCPACHGLQCREGGGLTETTLPVPACNQGSAGRCPLRRGHRAGHLGGFSDPGTHASVAAHADGRTPPLSDAGTRRPGDPAGTPRLRAAMGLHVANRKPRGTQPLCHHRGGTRAAYLLLGCVPTCLTDFSSV